MNDAVEQLLAWCTPVVQPLARKVYERLLAVFPGAAVSVDRENIGFGTSSGYRNLVLVVTPHRAHVNLGFARGFDLPDPTGLLEGAGKAHRHVKIRSTADLDRPDLRDLITAQLRRARS